MVEVGTATFRAVAKFDDLVSGAKRGESALRDLKGQTGQSGTAAADAAVQQTRLGDRLNEMGERATRTGRKLSVGLTAPIVGIATLGVKSFMDFESAIVRAGAVTGASGQQIEEFTALALKMGAETKFSASDAANALVTMGESGLNASQAMQALPGVMLAASAAGSDLAFTGEVVVQTLNAFQLPATEAARVADVIAESANASALTMDGFAEAMAHAGSLGSSAGQELESVTAVLMQLTNAGVPAAMAGTAVRQAMETLQAPTKKAAGTIKDLGIEVRNADGTMRQLPDIVSELQVQLSEANPKFVEFAKANKMGSVEARDLALNNIFGVQGMKAMNLAMGTQIEFAKADASAMEDVKTITAVMGEEFVRAADKGDRFVFTGGDMTKALAALLQESEGAASAMDELRKATAAAGFEELLGSLETMAITIVTQVAPQLKGMFDWLEKLFNAIGRFAAAHPRITMIGVAFAGVLALVGPLLIVFGLMAQGLGSILNLGSRLLGWMGRGKTAAGALAKGLQGPKDKLGTVPSTSGRAATGLSGAVQRMKTAVAGFVSAVGRGVAAIGRFMWSAVAAIGRGIASATTWVARQIWMVTTTAAKWAWMSLQAGVHGAKVAAVWLAKGAVFVAQWVAQMVAMVAKTVAQWVIMGARAVAHAAVVAGAWLISHGAAIVAAVVSMAVGVAATVGGWLAMAAAAVVNAAIVAASWLVAFWPVALVIAIVAGLVFLIWKYWDEIKAAIGAGWDWVKEKTSAVWNAVSGWLSQKWASLRQWASATWNDIKSKLGAAWDWVKQKTTAVWNSIRDGIRNVWDKVKQIVSQGVEAVKGFVGRMADIGADFVRGIWNGISRMGGWLWDQVTGFVRRNIVDPAKNLLRIGSPSKVAAEQAREVVRGWAAGLRDAGPVLAAVGGLTSKIMSAMPAMTADVNVHRAARAAAGVTQFAFDFSGATLGPGVAQEIRTAVTDDEVVRRLIHAARGGRRA